MPEILIFKAGKYAQGDWPKERVQKLVDAYNPEKNYEAPVVIGHKWYAQTDEDEYAHGWVKSLRMDGAGKVYADIEFDAKAKRALAEKNLRYVSAEIYEWDKQVATEAPYLRAVSLLGRSTPAVQGTRLPSLFGAGTLTVIEANKDTICQVAAFTRKASSVEVQQFGLPEISEEEKHVMEETEKLKAELAAKEAELSVFRKELDEFKSAGKKQDAEGYYGKLRDEGKLLPALYEKAVALDVKMNAEERKDLRGLFAHLDTTVDLSGAHIADKQKAPPPGDDISARIKAFQKEKGIASFAEAAEALYAAQPGVFEEGGAV